MHRVKTSRRTSPRPLNNPAHPASGPGNQHRRFGPAPPTILTMKPCKNSVPGPIVPTERPKRPVITEDLEPGMPFFGTRFCRINAPLHTRGSHEGPWRRTKNRRLCRRRLTNRRRRQHCEQEGDHGKDPRQIHGLPVHDRSIAGTTQLQHRKPNQVHVETSPWCDSHAILRARF